MNDELYTLDDYIMPVSVGDEVPDLEFEAYHDEKVKKMKMSDFRGKWLVVMFYPADFTFVCPTELEDMADHYETCQGLDAEVISFSSDTVFTHKAWHDTSKAVGKIKFPMGADPSGKVARTFGVYIEGEGLAHKEDEGLALRGTFIVSPEGKLLTSEIHSNNIGRSAKELCRKLKAAKFVAEHGGQVCPANWDEGGDTLEPGLDLVGKI